MKDKQAKDILDEFKAGTITAAQRDEYNQVGAERDQFRAAAAVSGAAAGVFGLLGLGLFVFDRPTPIQSPPEMGPATPKPDQEKKGPHLEMRVVPAASDHFAGVVATGRF